MRVERDFPGHFIGAPACRFFRTTDVNGWRVSTVGDYRPHGDKQRGEPTMIGWQRYYETMVFRLGETPCGCGCGAMEVASWSEQDMDGYDTEAAAAEGHEQMVEKYAAITPEPRSPERRGGMGKALRDLLIKRLAEIQDDQYEEITGSMRDDDTTERFVKLVCEDWPEDEEAPNAD